MRISDWSSDVCSSDLLAIARDGEAMLTSARVPVADDLNSLTGRGVTAKVEGETVQIGKVEMFGTDGIAPIGDEVATAIAGLREQIGKASGRERGCQDV